MASLVSIVNADVQSTLIEQLTLFVFLTKVANTNHIFMLVTKTFFCQIYDVFYSELFIYWNYL